MVTLVVVVVMVAVWWLRAVASSSSSSGSSVWKQPPGDDTRRRKRNPSAGLTVHRRTSLPPLRAESGARDAHDLPSTTSSVIAEQVSNRRPCPDSPFRDSIGPVRLPIPHVSNKSSWGSVRLTAPQWAHGITYLWSKVIVALAAPIIAEDDGLITAAATEPNPLGPYEEVTFSLPELSSQCTTSVVRNGTLDVERTMNRLAAINQRFARRRRLPVVYVETVAVKAFVDTVLPEYERQMALSARGRRGNRPPPPPPRSRIAAEEKHQRADGDHHAAGRQMSNETTHAPQHLLILSPMVILTHCRDAGIRQQYRSQTAGGSGVGLNKAMASPAIYRWYASNCDVSHPKVQCMPLGFAFHDTLAKEGEHPAVTADKITNAYLAAPSNRDRRPLSARVDDWNERNNPLRRDIWQQLTLHREFVTVFSPAFGRRNFSHLLAGYAAAAFVLSPPGNGFDCHRTWEAIAMGVIPILWNASAYRTAQVGAAAAVEFEGEMRVYDSFPVVAVNNYSDITMAKLREWQTTVRDERHNRFDGFADERITNVFWMHRIYGDARRGFDN